jgi:hypothetical protein
MAVTKIKPVKANVAVKNSVEYILNPDKTDGKMLVSSYGCSYETAYEEFNITLSQALEKEYSLSDARPNRAHHLIQAFEPGETTPDQAHEIGKRLADEVTQGKYEYILTTHIDKGHIHNHILFCAASFEDHKKYVSNKGSYYGIRKLSDDLCKEYGLSVIKPGRGKNRDRGGHAKIPQNINDSRKPAAFENTVRPQSFDNQQGPLAGSGDNPNPQTWKGKLKTAIDTIIPQSKDIDDFLKRLEASGYEIKRGKYISVRAPGQERFTRTKTLGVDYAEDAIIKRIAGEYTVSADKKEKAFEFSFEPSDASYSDSEPTRTDYETPGADADVFAADTSGAESAPQTRVPAVNLIVDIESSVKAQQNAGYARWQKIQNLKEAAKTLNFLTENKLLQYTDLESKANDVNAHYYRFSSY